MQRRTRTESRALTSASLEATIHQVVSKTKIYDIHTHLYDSKFGSLLLWGIDELLTYHYLVAEAFRYHRMDYSKFWSLGKTEQADLVWDLLFIQNSPLSESCRGVLTCLHSLGLDVKKRDLSTVRKHFKSWSTEKYVDHVLKLSNVERVIMTNNPFDDLEKPTWEKRWNRDERFQTALRLDDILVTWPQAVPRLREWGFDIGIDLTQRTIDEIRRYLHEWIVRMKPIYLAVSLPPSFTFSDSSGPEPTRSRLITDCILPECEEHGIPFAMMIGVKKLTNPQLKVGGDSVGQADVGVVEQMCAAWPNNRFLVTMLARENQHALCVTARKFHNLHVFGCWWFLNNPSIIDEITRERLELLGLSMTPQHSDARVLDQLLYKWSHFREILTKILIEKYSDIQKTGWAITVSDIERYVQNLFGGAFQNFLR
jgi:hypothetical protein